MIFSHIFGGQVSPTSDWGWSGFTGMFTQSGRVVNGDSALQNTAVYACVKLLSETVASLPLNVYRRAPNGDKEALYDHPLYDLLHNSPNGIQTSFEFRELLQGYVGLRGNAYALKEADINGRIYNLIPIHPDMVEPKATERGGIVYKCKIKHGETYSEAIYTSGEMFHLRGFGTDVLMGLNPIEAHRETVGASLAAQDYGSRFFSNDATPRGILTHPTQFKDEEAIERFRASWRKAQGGEKQHSTAVLENGITYTQTGMTNEDAQFLETRKYSVSDIARIFRVPPHMIGDLEKATFSNIEHQGIEFVVHTIRPWLTRWEQAIKRDMIAESDVFVEFNVDGLLRGDTSARYTAYGMGIRDGHLTRNEVRRLENRNPLPGLDEVLVPMNMDDSSKRDSDDEAIARIVKKEYKAIRFPLEEAVNVLGNHHKRVIDVLKVSKKTAEIIVDGLSDLYEQHIELDDFNAIRTAQIKEVLKCSNT